MICPDCVKVVTCLSCKKEGCDFCTKAHCNVCKAVVCDKKCKPKIKSKLFKCGHTTCSVGGGDKCIDCVRKAQRDLNESNFQSDLALIASITANVKTPQVLCCYVVCWISL